MVFDFERIVNVSMLQIGERHFVIWSPSHPAPIGPFLFNDEREAKNALFEAIYPYLDSWLA